MLPFTSPISSPLDFRSNRLWVAGLITLIEVGTDGSGALIAMGVKVGLLPK
jgi:hypothetical protein